MRIADGLRVRGPVVDILLSKCAAIQYFKRHLLLRKETKNPDVTFQSAHAVCRLCKDVMIVEGISDMYPHLYEKHRTEYITSMIGTNDNEVCEAIDGETISFCKEEVKAISMIQNYLAQPVESLSQEAKKLMAKRVRDVYQNRLESKVFKDDKVFNMLVDNVEMFLGIEVSL